jgi:hypothetical protein
LFQITQGDNHGTENNAPPAGARTFLRHIRETSKEELKERILKGIAEFNEAPVPFRWKKFDLQLN